MNPRPFLLAFCLAMATAAPAATVCTEFPAAFRPDRSFFATGLATGDYDADGHEDIHVRYAGTIYFGNGDGSFETAPAPLQSRLADLNGDGYADALSIKDGKIRVQLGRDRTFGDPVAAVDTHDYYEIFDVADLDGDGDPDLVAKAYLSIRTLLNDGTGHFRVLSSSIDHDLGPRLLIDFDSDGFEDVVYVNHLRQLQWLRGDGQGGFRTARALDISPERATYQFASQAVDLNGDGHEDLMMLDYTKAIIVVYGPVDPSSGASIATRRFALPAPTGEGILAADFNGDGATDLAVKLGTLSVFLNDGSGGLDLDHPTFTLPQFSSVASDLETSDFNSDGALDLVVKQGDHHFTVIFGRGDGTFGLPRVALPAEGRLIGTFDFNGDGEDELIVHRPAQLDVGSKRRDASAYDFEAVPVSVDTSFDPQSTYPPARTIQGNHPVTAGNVLGGAAAEIVAASGTRVRTFSRDLSGAWSEAASFDAGAPVRGLAAANLIESDSEDEIAVVTTDVAVDAVNSRSTIDRRNCRATLQIRSAAGLLSYRTQFPCTHDIQVRSADFDHDGHVDLLVSASGQWEYCGFICGHGYAYWLDGWISLFRGTGNGTFFEDGLRVVGNVNVEALAIGDYNGDGHLDFAAALVHHRMYAWTYTDAIVFYGDGFGSFTTRKVLLDHSVRLAAGDVTGDGIDDLIVQDDGAISYYHGSRFGLTERELYAGHDMPWLRRTAHRTPEVLVLLTPGDLGVIERGCQ